MTEVIQDKNASDLVCVMLDVHIWSGRRHLELDDLVQANQEFRELPSETLATLGAYKICDPKDIKNFHQIKGKAERYLRRQGLPILGAVGIPAGKFEAVHLELAKYKAQFDDAAATFVAAFDTALEQWKQQQLAENPKYAHLLHHTPAADQVEKRISFTYHPYRISAPADAMNPDLNAHYESQVGGLKGELLTEVASEASQLITDYLMGRGPNGVVQKREYVTQKTLGPLKRAAAKLDSFRFLDPSIGPLADAISEVVNALPVQRIEGASLIKLWTLARALSSPADAIRMAEMAMEGVAGEDILASQAIATAAIGAAPSVAADAGQQRAGEIELLQALSVAPRASASSDLSLVL
jgi:hypothetical protein